MPRRKLTEPQTQAATVVVETRQLERQILALLEEVRADRNRATTQALDRFKVPVSELVRLVGTDTDRIDRKRIYTWAAAGRNETH